MFQWLTGYRGFPFLDKLVYLYVNSVNPFCLHQQHYHSPKTIETWWKGFLIFLGLFSKEVITLRCNELFTFLYFIPDWSYRFLIELCDWSEYGPREETIVTTFTLCGSKVKRYNDDVLMQTKLLFNAYNDLT